MKSLDIRPPAESFLSFGLSSVSSVTSKLGSQIGKKRLGVPLTYPKALDRIGGDHTALDELPQQDFEVDPLRVAVDLGQLHAVRKTLLGRVAVTEARVLAEAVCFALQYVQFALLGYFCKKSSIIAGDGS